VQGVHGGSLAHGPDARPDRPGVVVQQVELLASLVGLHGVSRLVPGVTDEFFRRRLLQRRDQFGLGLGARWSEQGDLVAAVGQPVGQQRHHPSMPP
jgi:hypothetical protein